MPIEAGQPLTSSETPAMHPLAARRILRLALGTALALLVAQAFSWQLAYMAPVITLVLLGLPMPALSIKKGLAVVLVLLLPLVLFSLVLLPLLEWARWSGIVMVALALFYCFLFTARGGSPALGAVLTICLTLVVTIGSVNQDILVLLISAIAINASLGVVFVWIAFAILPDPPADGAPAAPQKNAGKDTHGAARRALRSLFVVLPLALLFLFSSGSAAFTPVMIKVASLGQQASVGSSRALGRSLVLSTLWGGAAASLVWLLLSAWPSLIFYTLLVALAALYFGRRMFRGAGMHADAAQWSYALLTMLILLGPSVTDSPLSDGLAFAQRLGLFLLVAFYGTAAVAVFDAFFAGSKRELESGLG